MHQYEKTGILCTKDFQIPSEEQLKKGVAILECVQEIPCNPCVASCPVHAISMKDINAPPMNDFEKCIGCTKCVGVCPGLAIFVIKKVGKKAWVTLPYEFVPVPKVGDTVQALDRTGSLRGTALVKKVIKQGKTMVITIEIESTFAMDIRNIRV
ncbi:MAG: 4Fe-4S binding protein [Candidatus Thermoplasmatota archaeon]|jgi:Fe-S-cluster-containing hydrogenase component 2|nr:4Fe-4S binding protein [Candidatus Thermoplasmatota archaeon]